MRRVIAVILVLGAAAGLAVLTTGASDDEGGQRYWVQLDNSFGLVQGGDVKVAGVRAGKVKTMKLDKRSYYALVEIEITKTGFDGLRKDVFCETRPQSLIGEYFIDCKPGTSREKLESGATIPVRQTGTTVPVDLVNSIMRRPFRERFTIILNELGAALAARGPALNETIRRANPALRETDRVLAQLAEQRETVRALYRDADRVVGALAGNRDDVTRFVQEARDTAGAQASERENLRRQFQRLPTFLRELRPTATLLGQVADEQTPVLRNLNRNAGRLEAFFDALGPFAQASRPAVRSLADVSKEGRPAVKSGVAPIAELRKSAVQLPELGRNLAYVLEDLDDPGRATETDTRAPNGKGYSGLEAILRYVYAQTQAINLFDGSNFILKVAPFVDSLCSPYTDAKQAKESRRDRCVAKLGPNRPGITSADPTATGDTADERGAAPDDESVEDALEPATPPAPTLTGQPGDAPPAERERGPPPAAPLETLLEQLPPAVRERIEKIPGLVPGLPAPTGPSSGSDATGDLLDYLLTP